MFLLITCSTLSVCWHHFPHLVMKILYFITWQSDLVILLIETLLIWQYHNNYLFMLKQRSNTSCFTLSCLPGCWSCCLSCWLGCPGSEGHLWNKCSPVRAGRLRSSVGLPSGCHRLSGRHHSGCAGLHPGHQTRALAAGAYICQQRLPLQRCVSPSSSTLWKRFKGDKEYVVDSLHIWYLLNVEHSPN